MDLDARTLMLLVTALFTLSTFSLGLLWRMHRHLPGVAEWTAGLGLLASGTALLYARETIPDILSILFANILTTAGVGVIAIGNQKYAGHPPTWRTVGAVILALFASLTVLYDRPDHFQSRVIIVSLCLGILSMLAAWALARAPRSSPRHAALAQRALAATFAVNASINLARIAAELLWAPVEGRTMWVGMVTTSYFLWTVLVSFTLASGFPLMVTERLRNQLRRKVVDLDAARKTAEAALSEHRNFLSMISHEFRTPLGIISAAGEMIAYNLPPEDHKSANDVARIRRATRRLSNLVEGCLADEWLTTASQSLRAQSLDLKGVLADLASEYDVTLRWQVGGAAQLAADPYLLPIALSCIIDNACKYGQSRPGIAIEARTRLLPTADGHVARHFVIDVHDDGPGILPEERPRVFEKYYRAAYGLHRPGTGLGLFLARRILDLHGGTIEIRDPLPEDAGRARGCIVRMTVPQGGTPVEPADDWKTTRKDATQ
ncbi:MAG: HAMP domain-containing sensor histidine kinase [Rhodospirillaceae bacterium]